jgi:anti-anti-sigma factor
VAFSHTELSGTSVIALGSVLDINGVLEVGQEFRDFANKHNDYCVVDLHAVESIDSAGVGLVVECHRILRNNGGGISLVGDSAMSDQFARMGFGTEMTFFSSAEQAVESYTTETLDCDLDSLPKDLFD